MLTGTITPGDEPFALAQQFTSSPRGARLARQLAVRRMEKWGYPPACDASCAVALVVGELTANAVQHGRVRGRDFGLRVALDAAAGLVRIEVADAAPEKRPLAAPPSAHPEGESGRGLLMVDVLAVRWGSAPRRPIGKTVWAEVSVPVMRPGMRPGTSPGVAPGHDESPAGTPNGGRPAGLSL
ncbi:ATP-binding protein [Streptomyces longisporoflavus]|uniref:ATP-binding protein n=1 Tax=Streptomyces longisporoflavus TaxID=28044 RepID=A0ABW7QY96_9ACTN